MATMNKPIFNAVKILSPNKPVLIFVASRRQTRLTALDMISYAASDDNPKAFLSCSEIYIESVAEKLSDEALRHTITFGIGLHHAGLSSFDREMVEKMFLKGEIQVVVATATVSCSAFSSLQILRNRSYNLTKILSRAASLGLESTSTLGRRQR
jgi:activating signal cointegrator complex subunit 3